MNDGLRFDDDARVAALHRLEVLDTAVEEPFEKIVTLFRTVLSVPIVTVTLVDRDRQWFKAKHGIDQSKTPRSVSFCTHTIQQRHPLVVEDALLDPRFADSPLVVGAPHVRSCAGIPLRTPDGYNVGALCTMDTRTRQFSPAEVSILGNFANIVCDELELRQIARVDYLTRALTRRAFVEQGEREMERARRHGRPSSLVMLDVDHFKRVNDSFGHALGDQVLQQIADIATVALRPNDLFGRLGGEEFALLLPETTGTAAIRGGGATSAKDRRAHDDDHRRQWSSRDGELRRRGVIGVDQLVCRLARKRRPNAICCQNRRTKLHETRAADPIQRECPQAAMISPCPNGPDDLRPQRYLQFPTVVIRPSRKWRCE